MGEWKDRKKEKRKEEKNALFHPQNGVLPLSREKKEIPQNPSVFKGLGGKKKGEKEEEMDGFRIRFLRRDSGEKGWKKGREKKGKNALFQSFRGAFLSPEEGRNPVISREGNGKKKEKKDEVLGLEDRIFRGRLEEW